MKFISQLFAAAALIAAGVAAVEDGVRLSPTFGGPHGNKYDDKEMALPGQRIKSLTIRTGERVNGVGIEIEGREPLYHGGGGGDKDTLTTGDGEYITGIEAHWGEYHSHTRVRYIKFTTNRNNSVDGGTRATKIGIDTAPKGFQLGGFFGTSGKELDSVGVYSTRINADAGSDEDNSSDSGSGEAASQ